MLFSSRPRTLYRKPPVHEVICQLRFPPILAISDGDPFAFQETIRDQFPQYARRQDVPNNAEGPRQPVANHHFLSEDGRWRLNLTQDFIALSTLTYPGWESFARRLDRPLAAFIERYRPGNFQRVGLRYVNLFSRAQLGLKNLPWTELIAPAYTAPLREPDVSEDRLVSCGCDLAVRLDSSCQARIHTGLGQVKARGVPETAQDSEERFILDIDLSMNGSVSGSLAAGALETVHAHAARIFEGVITSRMREAMEPLEG